MDETPGLKNGYSEKSRPKAIRQMKPDFPRIVISTEELCELRRLDVRGLVCTPSIHFERIGEMGKGHGLIGKGRGMRNRERKGKRLPVRVDTV